MFIYISIQEEIVADDVDWNRVDDAALALLWLTLHEGDRVWKQLDWGITDRLHARGLISNPKSKAKSVFLEPEGLEHAQRVFRELFAKGGPG